MPGRILALDYGHRRIGLALSDPHRELASPLPPLLRQGDYLGRLKQLIADRQVDELLLGLPIGLNGQEGRAAKNVRQFGCRLEAETGLPLTYFDERFTTSEAEGMMIQAGAKRSKRKSWIDSVAASLLLESYLSSLNQQQDNK